MRRITLVFLLLSCLHVAASKEGILILGKFRLESEGIGESGRVVVSGTQGYDGPTSVRIEAFGKSYSLAPAHIRQLRGLTANGIQLSYERGYRELGGRTVYIFFSKGFISGSVAAKYVSVAERGDIEVKDAESS
jgi:hypothetical protein